MGHHFGVSPHANVAASELVLQACVHPFYHRALAVALLLRRTEAQRATRLERTLPAGVRMGIDDRHVPQTATLFADVMGVVSGIHQLIAVGDPLRSDGCQRDGYLGVVEGG